MAPGSRSMVKSFKRQASGYQEATSMDREAASHKLATFKGYNRIMKLNELIKKINKENAPPDGWKPEDDIKKAINWDKLKDPKVLKQLEKIFKDA